MHATPNVAPPTDSAELTPATALHTHYLLPHELRPLLADHEGVRNTHHKNTMRHLHSSSPSQPLGHHSQHNTLTSSTFRTQVLVATTIDNDKTLQQEQRLPIQQNASSRE